MIEDKYRPLYHAAASRGIAATALDDCSLGEVRWMLAPVEDNDPNAPESPDEYRAAVAARMAGDEPTYEPFDIRTLELS